MQQQASLLHPLCLLWSLFTFILNVLNASMPRHTLPINFNPILIIRKLTSRLP